MLLLYCNIFSFARTKESGNVSVVVFPSIAGHSAVQTWFIRFPRCSFGSFAGLKLTFPSRTRSIRGLTTMVLHNRVWESMWESSSTPGFFLPQLRKNLMPPRLITASIPPSGDSSLIKAVQPIGERRKALSRKSVRTGTELG